MGEELFERGVIYFQKLGFVFLGDCTFNKKVATVRVVLYV
jgi:hypothetical protein